MCFRNILSIVISSLIRLQNASALNCTNFVVHEVSKTKVSLQDEVGVYIVKLIFPTKGAVAALLALVTVAVIVMAIVFICIWCGVKCTNSCCP